MRRQALALSAQCRCCARQTAIALRPLPHRSFRNFNTTPATLQVSPLKSDSTVPSLFTPTDNPTKPFFITTPIFYVNASPHIGHLHSLVLTDVLARFSALRNPQRPVIFSTGTDEHGLKVQQAAKKEGVPEEEFCARVSERFRDLADKANVEYTDFIRTSEERHHRAVEHFWNKLVEKGDIYKGTHSGWYSVSDESFYSQSQVTKTDDGRMVSIETGNEVIWEEETNWKFRLPKYRDQVLQWVQQPHAVYPETMRAYIVKSLDTLEDLSVSRPKSRVKWGVSVPGDPEQTIYVWVDALINYITVLGYPGEAKGWPADVQVVGKDIIKFHALHWPALLLSAGLVPPQRVLAHAHWTMGKFKMSKSRGNVVDPITAISVFGPDSVRWYLMRAGGSLPDDSDYSDEQLRANHGILASQFGNLLARLSSSKMIRKVGKWDVKDEQPGMDERLRGVRDEVERRMEGYEVTKACEAIIEVVAEANRVFTRLEPWSAPDSTAAIVYAYNALRIAAILLQPIMPHKSVELLDRLGVDPDSRMWDHAVWDGPGSVDVAAMKERLLASGREWKGKGHLIERVDDPVAAVKEVEAR